MLYNIKLDATTMDEMDDEYISMVLVLTLVTLLPLILLLFSLVILNDLFLDIINVFNQYLPT